MLHKRLRVRLVHLSELPNGITGIPLRMFDSFSSLNDEKIAKHNHHHHHHHHHRHHHHPLWFESVRRRFGALGGLAALGIHSPHLASLSSRSALLFLSSLHFLPPQDDDDDDDDDVDDDDEVEGEE